MKHLKVIAFLVVMFPLFSPAASAATCTDLTRNLKLGMEGQDILLLQRTLNASPVTRIAESGLGSPGNETTYFGGRTYAAVVRFQDLYRNEVLVPNGLSKGTGFVGASTRSKLRSLCAATAATPATPAVPTANPATPAVPASPLVTPSVAAVLLGSIQRQSVATVTKPYFAEQQFAKLEVMYPSDDFVKPGKRLTVYGTGFTIGNTNTVYIGDTYRIDGVGVNSYGLLDLTIPKNAPKGRFSLWVTNANGTSNKNATIVIVDPNAVPPAVESVTPPTGNFGTSVTITGSGFLPTGNDVYFTTGKITGVSSLDGKTLRVVVPGEPMQGISGTLQGGGFMMMTNVYVTNTNGKSNAEKFLIAN